MMMMMMIMMMTIMIYDIHNSDDANEEPCSAVTFKEREMMMLENICYAEEAEAISADVAK